MPGDLDIDFYHPKRWNASHGHVQAHRRQTKCLWISFLQEEHDDASPTWCNNMTRGRMLTTVADSSGESETGGILSGSPGFALAANACTEASSENPFHPCVAYSSSYSTKSHHFPLSRIRRMSCSGEAPALSSSLFRVWETKQGKEFERSATASTRGTEPSARRDYKLVSTSGRLLHAGGVTEKVVPCMATSPAGRICSTAVTSIHAQNPL